MVIVASRPQRRFRLESAFSRFPSDGNDTYDGARIVFLIGDDETGPCALGTLVFVWNRGIMPEWTSNGQSQGRM
jgi:hypothetical protein